MPSKIQPKSLIKKNTETNKDKDKDKKTKQQGGLESKDDPDKKDKNDYDASENEEVDEEENEEDLENLEESEEETVESEGEEIEKEKEEEEGGEGYEEAGEDDSCVYKFTKKKQVIDLDLEAGEDQFEDQTEGEQEAILENIYVPNNERVTKKILFNYERVRILGERARQLSLGAKPMLKNVENLDPKTVAKLELEHKVIPLIILRELPNGRIEKWKVSELKF
jgi:DNA-directed RNA polymerase subunit K/omega